VGQSRQKLQKWWKNRENIRSSSHKYKRKRTKNTYKAYHSEMESKLKEWIIQQRALGVCISGFVIRVKVFELERDICEQTEKPCLFRASTGWMLHFLRAQPTSFKKNNNDWVRTCRKRYRNYFVL
jgi:hypothetical protein